MEKQLKNICILEQESENTKRLDQTLMPKKIGKKSLSSITLTCRWESYVQRSKIIGKIELELEIRSLQLEVLYSLSIAPAIPEKEKFPGVVSI